MRSAHHDGEYHSVVLGRMAREGLEYLLKEHGLSGLPRRLEIPCHVTLRPEVVYGLVYVLNPYSKLPEYLLIAEPKEARE